MFAGQETGVRCRGLERKRDREKRPELMLISSTIFALSKSTAKGHRGAFSFHYYFFLSWSDVNKNLSSMYGPWFRFYVSSLLDSHKVYTYSENTQSFGLQKKKIK